MLRVQKYQELLKLTKLILADLKKQTSQQKDQA